MSSAVKTKEARMAELLAKLESLFDADGGFPKLQDRVKALQEQLDELKGLDLSRVSQEVDRIKAAQQAVANAIRSSRRGLYISGQEDQQFSVLKAMLAVRTGDWSRAGHEQEMMKQWRELATKANAQAAGDDALGGYFIADQVIAEVIAAIYTKSVFVNLVGEEGTTRVSVIEGLTGGTVKIPKFDGGVIAYWIGEQDTFPDSAVTVGDINMAPHKLGILVRITDTMRKFQSYGFEQLLRRDMERAAAKLLDYTIAFGTGGANSPRGIVNTNGVKIFSAESGKSGTLGTDALGGAQFQADWQGAELDFDGLDNMMLALEEDDIVLDPSFAFISAPRYWKRMKQLKVDNYVGQNVNRPYILGMPTLSDAQLRDAMGVDFDGSNQFASNLTPGQTIGAPTTSTTAKFTDVIGGNLMEVLLGRWFGLEIEDDAGRGKGFVSDHIYMKLRMYADVQIRQPRGIIVAPDVRARN